MQGSLLMIAPHQQKHLPIGFTHIIGRLIQDMFDDDGLRQSVHHLDISVHRNRDLFSNAVDILICLLCFRSIDILINDQQDTDR